MFENSGIYALLDNGEINKIEIDSSVQKSLSKHFSSMYSIMFKGKKVVEFDGNYKLEPKEISVIKDYVVNKKIINAIENPLSLVSYNPFEPKGKNIKPINAIFVGEKSKSGRINIVFQKIYRFKNIQSTPFRFIYENEIFKLNNKIEINISNNSDCIYKDNNLYFSSFYKASTILDLKQYFKDASNEDINKLFKSSCFVCSDINKVKKVMNSSMRKKLYRIMNSPESKNLKFDYIKGKADEFELDIKIKNNKVVFPVEIEEMEQMIDLLNNSFFRGAMDNKVYISNSKKVFKKSSSN